MRQAQALTNTASPAAAPSQAPAPAKPSASASLRSNNDAPEQPVELSFEPGSRLRAGRYAVGALVSCSLLSEVWHAQQAATGEQVVIKVSCISLAVCWCKCEALQAKPNCSVGVCLRIAQQP